MKKSPIKLRLTGWRHYEYELSIGGSTFALSKKDMKDILKQYVNLILRKSK